MEEEHDTVLSSLVCDAGAADDRTQSKEKETKL